MDRPGNTAGEVFTDWDHRHRCQGKQGQAHHKAGIVEFMGICAIARG
jgi:hypothetical protein